MKGQGARAHLLREHRWVLAGCGVILAVLVFAFAVLFSNVRAMIRNARQLMDAQLTGALEQTQSLFENYSRLCSILGANTEVAQFASFSAGVPDDTLALKGYSLQKELASLVSVYGADLNNLALYFPVSGSVITMSRHLHGQEARLFWDGCPELRPDALRALPSGTWWNVHFAPQSKRSWIVHKLQVRENQTVLVLIEYNLGSFSSRLKGQSDELALLAGGADRCFFTSGPALTPDAWRQVSAATDGPSPRRVDGESYFALSAASRIPGLLVSVLLPAGHVARIEALFYLVVAVTGAVVLLCLGSMLFYLSKRVFTPLQQLTRVGNYADGDIQKTLRAVAEDYRSLAHSQDQLRKEREHLVPLALGRSLVRLSEREKGEPAYTQADSCLWMAGIAPGEGYALFAVTCVEDAQGFFVPAQGGAPASPPSDLFYYLLNNILNDLLFQEHPGTIAVLPGGWYAVLTACADEGQAQAVTAVSQRLPGVYAEVFSATLLVTDVSWGAGARQFFEDANQLFRKTSFLQFWGSPPSGEETTFEQLSFTNYCRLVRKLTNRLGAQDYEDLPEMLDEILLQAASTDAEDVQITKKRIYAMTSILAIAIDEQLSEEREFVDSLHLEERLYGAESIAAFRRELREILSTLIAHREAATAQDPTGRLMEAVRRYLLAHYRETGLNVTSVAQQFHISVSYLSRSFKETQGVNLLEYIQRLRVDAAKKLLVGSSIKAVAQQVGFWDTQGLIRAFKKCEGIGPGEYKKMLENQNDPHALQ